MAGRRHRRPAGAGTGLLSFDSLYGLVYDTSINLRPLAAAGLRLGWGADPDLLVRMMESALTCAPGELAIDCPAGGATAIAAAGARIRGRVVGLDLSLPMLRRAGRRVSARGLASRVWLVQADATALPLPEAGADRAACFMSLHCIAEQAAVLCELHRVLRPGGVLLGATLCADPPLPWRLPVRAGRVRAGFFTPPRQADLESWGRAAGFEWRQERHGAMLYFSATRPATGGRER